MNKKIFLLFLYTTFYSLEINSQSLTGMEGLLLVPSAEIMTDGKISFGVSFFKREILPSSFVNDGLAYYASVGFLPFMETSIRFTKTLNYIDALGDRMFNFKFRFIEEQLYLPAVAIGLHDLAHSTENKTNRFAASYIVLTKNIRINVSWFNLKLVAGYGTDWISSSSSQFIGIFGGISIGIMNDQFNVLVEYDADRYNAGLGLNLFNHIKLIGGLMDMKHFSGGASFSFQL